MIDLRGKRALVTGGAKRVGRAIALALGGEGMHVAVHYRSSRSEAEQTCRTIRERGGQATAFTADLASRGESRLLVDEVTAALGGLDLLVASAAGFDRVPYADLDDGAWDRMMELNAASPFALAHQATPWLRAARGSIVFLTCSSATTPFRNYLPYVVSKGALRTLTRVLSLELAPDVRVNAVAPGTVLPPESMSERDLERLRGRIPLGELGSPADVADAVVYLARAPFVTGHEILVDGGRTVAGFERFG